MNIKNGRKDFEIDVHESNGIRGLMFYRRKTAPILLFNFHGRLHSLFVFFSFLVVWLDNENNVLDSQIVNTWKLNVNSKSNYVKILEIPISKKYSKTIDFLHGKRFIKN